MSQYPKDLQELLGPSTLPVVIDAASPPTALAGAVGGGLALGETAYEGASHSDQLALWGPSIRSGDAEILPEKSTLDARSRDMVRNDAYVRNGATLHKDNIVGARFMLNAKPMSAVLFGREDEQFETEFQEEVETKFALWAEGPERWGDAQRVKTLTDFVRLAVGSYTATGEVLATAEWMPNDGRPYRTATQMVDTDRLCTPYNSFSDHRIRGGVERDRYGAPIAYHIRNGHPSDYYNPDAYIWRRVMARKPWGRPMVLHIYEQDRADQSRGVAAMVAALQEIKMTKGFRKVQLQQAVLQATYAASIESDLPSADVFNMMGGNDEQNKSVQWMLEYLGAINDYQNAAQNKNLVIEGTKIPVFAPGTSLKLQNTGNSGPDVQFEQSLLRYIAAILNVSYEQLSKDYSQTNYASHRAAQGETRKAMLTKKARVADRAGSFKYGLWLEEAINNNDLECLKRRRVPAFYDGLNQAAYTNCEWIGAGMGMTDPLKETQAVVLQLEKGVTSKETAIAQLHGGDWRNTARQIKRERALDESLGNTPIGPSDDQMMKALSGTPQERES